MTHCTLTGKATNGSGTQPFLRTTASQFYTTAQLAREQGATGVSLFNFPYYRYHVTDDIGPFHEPPFEVLAQLKNCEFPAEQKPWYFLTSGRKDPVLGARALPIILKRSQPGEFSFLLSNTLDHRRDGLLRLRSDEEISDRELVVTCRGSQLDEVDFVEKPVDHPYDDTWLGTAEDTRCFRVPKELARPPDLKVEINVNKGIRVRLKYMDLSF